MLNEPAIRSAVRRRNTVMLTTMVLAVGAMLLYFLLVGPAARNFFQLDAGPPPPLVSLALIAPAFVLFLAPTIAAERYCKRFECQCPSCGGSLARRTGQVLATRRCPECEKQIIAGGQPRRSKAYRRYHKWRQFALLEAWFWIWPALGALSMVFWLVDPELFAECPQVLFVAPLIGAVAGGWTWLRTANRRYAASWICSCVLLLLGGLAFWSSI